MYSGDSQQKSTDYSSLELGELLDENYIIISDDEEDDDVIFLY